MWTDREKFLDTFDFHYIFCRLVQFTYSINQMVLRKMLANTTAVVRHSTNIFCYILFCSIRSRCDWFENRNNRWIPLSLWTKPNIILWQQFFHWHVAWWQSPSGCFYPESHLSRRCWSRKRVNYRWIYMPKKCNWHTDGASIFHLSTYYNKKILKKIKHYELILLSCFTYLDVMAKKNVFWIQVWVI